MHLIFVHPNLVERGGAERKMLLMVAELLRRGHTVQLLVNNFKPETTFHELIPAGFSPMILRGGKITWFAKVIKYLLRFSPDVTIAHNHPAQVPVGLYKLIRPQAVCGWICNEVMPLLAPKSSIFWKVFYSLDKFLVSRLNRCIVNSSFTGESFSEWYGGNPVRLYSGVQLYDEIGQKIETVPPLDAELPEQFVFILSRLEYHKNIRFLETLAASLPEAQFVVAGKGKAQHYVQELQQKFMNIMYLGGVSELVKFRLYKKATVFAFLPIAEPLGVTTMESIGSGTPVVAFNSGGPREVIRNNKNGSLCDSEEAYLEALRMWLALRGDKSLSGEDFEGYIKENFSNEVMVKRFSDEFEKLIN